MDRVMLGQRITQSRELMGLTQEALGKAVGLDRTAISRLEKGDRKLNVSELVAVAQAVGLPLSYFVDDPVPAVVSRRREGAQAHQSTQALDIALEIFASDVRSILNMGLLRYPERDPEVRLPTDHGAAELLANALRGKLGLADDPIEDVGMVCQELGLHTFSAPLGTSGPDGACVELTSGDYAVAAAVINGQAPPGRRRMTLAHELGHWLFGDAYDHAANLSSEKMINSFAIHFLAPRSGVQLEWNKQSDWPVRDRALAIAARFRLSWSAAISQLRNLGLVSWETHATLTKDEPHSGDYVRLAISWNDELATPYLSPAFAAACVEGYMQRRLTEDRALELLRETLSAEELPGRPHPDFADLSRAFKDHDASPTRLGHRHQRLHPSMPRWPFGPP